MPVFDNFLDCFQQKIARASPLLRALPLKISTYWPLYKKIRVGQQNASISTKGGQRAVERWGGGGELQN